MTKVILVRHAEAEGNYKRLFQGHHDAPVSEKGRKQMDLLALRCRNMTASAIYSSPLKRAWQTAEAINQYHHLPLYAAPDLIEICGGVWENTPWKDLPVLYPQQAKNWNLYPWDFAPDNGEPMTAVYERVYRCFMEIVAKHPGETIFVVSHGCAIRNLLCRLQYDDIHHLNDIPWCDNTAISILEFDEQYHHRFLLENDASHLDKETSTLANQVWCKPGVKEADVWS